MQELASMVREDASDKQPDMIGSSHQAEQTSIAGVSKGQPIVPGAQSPTLSPEAAPTAGDKGPDTGSHSLSSAQPDFLSNANDIMHTSSASTAQATGQDVPGRNAQSEHGPACLQADTVAHIRAQSLERTAMDATPQATDADAQAVAASATLNASEQPGDDPCSSATPAEKQADDACDQLPIKDQGAEHPVASHGKSEELPACSEQQQPPTDSVKENQTANAGNQQPAATDSQPEKATASAAQPPTTGSKGSKVTAAKAGTAGAKRAPTAYFIFANRHRGSAKQELVAKGHGPKVSVAEVSLL